jgi:transcriptional regulator with XRE-family HTH domain
MEILKRIRDTRIDKDITTVEMGRLLHMSHQNYEKIEKGKVALKLSVFIAICGIFKEHPAFFLAEDDEQKVMLSSSEAKTILDAVKIVERLASETVSDLVKGYDKDILK